MAKKFMSLAITALFAVAMATGVRAEEVALNANEDAKVVKAIEQVQAVALKAKAAGLTQDQTAELLANYIQNDPQLGGGSLTSNQKIMIAAAAVLIVAYFGVSYWRGSLAPWKWGSKEVIDPAIADIYQALVVARDAELKEAKDDKTKIEGINKAFEVKVNAIKEKQKTQAKEAKEKLEKDAAAALKAEIAHPTVVAPATPATPATTAAPQA